MTQTCWVLLLLACPVFAPWACADPVEVRVHGEEFVGPPLVGFGAQMNPYLYARPNWGEQGGAQGGVTERNVVDLERKVIELGPQFVRVFMAHEWREGKPDGVNKGGEPRMWESFLRTLRLAQRAGARITLTTWWGEPSFPERTAQRTAALLDELINREGFANLHSINMMNEPDMVWPGEENWTIPAYNRMYRELDAQLKRLGLRQRVQIISGDMVEDDQPRWLANIAENLADISGGISIHAYWQFDKTDWMLQRLTDTTRQAATQPSIRSKPLYVTEFGVQGISGEPGKEPWRDAAGREMCQTNLQALEIGWFMIEALRRGYVGLVQWDMYDVRYDRAMHYGVIGDAKSGWQLKPGYWVLKMFTHAAKPGWRAVGVGVTDPNIQATAVKGDDGEMAVFVLNRDRGIKAVRVNGLRDGRVRLITWNQEGNGRLSNDATEAWVKGEQVQLICPGESIVAVTP